MKGLRVLYDFLNQYKVGDGETALNLRFSKPESILFLLIHLFEKLKVLLFESLR